MIHAEEKTQTHKANHPQKKRFARLKGGEFLGQEQHLRPSETNEKAGWNTPLRWNKPGLYSEHEDISPWQSIKMVKCSLARWLLCETAKAGCW